MKELELSIREIDDLLEHLFRRLQGKTEGLSLLEPAVVLLQNLKDSNPTAYELNLRRFSPVIVDAYISKAYISFGYDGLKALLDIAPDISMISGDYTPAGVESGLEEVRSRIDDIRSILEGGDPRHAKAWSSSPAITTKKESFFRECVHESTFLPLVSVFNAGKSPITLGRIVQPHVELRITGEWSIRKKSGPGIIFDHMFAEPDSDFEKQIFTAIEVAERFAISRLGIRDIARMPREYRLSLPEAAITSSTLPGTMTGGSAGLSFTLMFISLLCKLGLSRKKFQIRPGTAYTGSVTENGAVLPVESSFVAEKVRAAFFSTCASLVLPAENLEVAALELDKLIEKYPERLFELIPAENMNVAQPPTRMLLQKSNHFPIPLLQKMLHRRKHLVGTVLSATLLALFLFVYPKYADKEVVHAELVDSTIVMTNKYNVRVASYDLGYSAPYLNSRSHLQFFVEDFDSDGKTSVAALITESLRCVSERPLADRCNLILFDNHGRFQHRTAFLDTDIMGDKMPEIDIRGIVMLSPFVETHYDSEGYGHLLFITNRTNRPPVIFHKFSFKDYSCEYFIHKGALREMILRDLDSDGNEELALFGYNYSLDRSVMIVLDPEHINGASPGPHTFSIPGLTTDIAKYYISFPRFHLFSNFGNPFGLLASSYLIDSDTLSVVSKSKGKDVQYVFNEKLECIDAKVWAKIRGEKLDGSDLHPTEYEGKREDEKELRRGVLYWDGQSWQSEVTINQSYLKAISSTDSTIVNHAKH